MQSKALWTVSALNMKVWKIKTVHSSVYGSLTRELIYGCLTWARLIQWNHQLHQYGSVQQFLQFLRLRIALLIQLLHICKSRHTGLENASVILEVVNIQYLVIYFCEHISRMISKHLFWKLTCSSHSKQLSKPHLATSSDNTATLPDLH